MNYLTIVEWVKNKFHVPILGSGVAIIVVIVLLFALIKGCNCNHPVTNVAKDSVTHTTTLSNDTSNNHSVSTETHVTEHQLFQNIPVPAVSGANIPVIKIHIKDSCSSVVLERTFPRSDGGYATLYAIVSCSKGQIDTFYFYNSPVRKDTITRDSFIYVYKLDSTHISHSSDSVTSKVHTNEVVTWANGVAYLTADPLFSNNFTIGVEGTLSLTDKWDFIVCPQLSYTPGNIVDFKHLAQMSFGAQYHIFDLQKNK